MQAFSIPITAVGSLRGVGTLVRGTVAAWRVSGNREVTILRGSSHFPCWLGSMVRVVDGVGIEAAEVGEEVAVLVKNTNTGDLWPGCVVVPSRGWSAGSVLPEGKPDPDAVDARTWFDGPIRW